MPPPVGIEPNKSVKAVAHSLTLALSPGRRLFMVACGYIPLLNVVMVLTVATLPAAEHWSHWTWCLAPVALLLVPPIVVRVLLTVRPLPTSDIAIGSNAFMVWWLSSQWQALFNRLPWIEEGMRLVPGLYSLWLRLWGSRVGKLVYWTPGLRVLDRSLIHVGDRVAFGFGVNISPHIIMPNKERILVLRVAAVRIGEDSVVGGYSLLLAGSWIAAEEMSPGRRELAPFTGWQHGQRVHPEEIEAETDA